MKKWIALTLSVLTGVAAAWLVRQWISDDARIRAQLRDLSSTISVRQAETDISRIARAAQIAKYFTEDAIVDLGAPFSAIQGRDAIVVLAAQARWVTGIDVDFVDLEIQVTGSDSASARLTAKATGLEEGDGVEARELEMMLRKVNERWLIRHVEGVNVLERPD